MNGVLPELLPNTFDHEGNGRFAVRRTSERNSNGGRRRTPSASEEGDEDELATRKKYTKKILDFLNPTRKMI